MMEIRIPGECIVNVTITTEGEFIAASADDFHVISEGDASQNHLLAPDGSSGAYYVHFFSDSIDADPLDADGFVYSPGIRSIIIQHLSDSLDVLTTKVLGGEDFFLRPFDIFTDSDKNIYLSGSVSCFREFKYGF